MKKVCVVLLGVMLTMNSWSQDTIKRSYEFRDGVMPRNVLESYLSRAITQGEFCLPESEAVFEENLRMIQNIGAKFIGRAAFEWTPVMGNEEHFAMAERFAERAHEADSTLLLQACVFEAVFKSEHNTFSNYGVDKISVPDWVFEEFGLEPEDRNFNYEAMLYPDGFHEWLWGFGGVPDITRLETQMYFFYRAARYIDAGFEGIHWGQALLMGRDDGPEYSNWFELLGRVREYAKENARRTTVICDAHAGYGIKNSQGQLLFDSHAFPQRVQDICGQPYEVEMVIGHGDAIYTKSLGGITPSGWECESLPYLVEFDNSGADSVHTCDNPSWYWPWGWDEATWFARNTPEYRNEYLRYAVNWLEENDPVGNLQMPGAITIAGDPIPLEGTDRYIWTYRLNNPSPTLPNAFGQEDVVKELWDNDKLNVYDDIPPKSYSLAGVYSIKFDQDSMYLDFMNGDSRGYHHDSYTHCDFTMESDSVLYIIPDTTTSGVRNLPAPNQPGNVFPNPFDDRIILDVTSKQAEPVEISIFDINGRELIHRKFSMNGRYSISTSSLESGIYICHIYSGSERTVTKIIKH